MRDMFLMLCVCGWHAALVLLVVKASAGGSCDPSEKKRYTVTGGERHYCLHPLKQDHLRLVGGLLCFPPQPPTLALAPSVHLAVCSTVEAGQ